MTQSERVLLVLLLLVALAAVLVFVYQLGLTRIYRDAYRDASKGWQETIDQWRSSSADTYEAWGRANRMYHDAWTESNEKWADALRLALTENEMLREHQ